MKNCRDVVRELMVVERAAWWNPRVRRILKAAPLVVMFLLLNARAARAACSFNPAPNPTVDGSSNSLRHAIQAANASGQDCLIQLQAGTYTLTILNTNGQENQAAQGDLDIRDSGHTVTIQGQGVGVSIVNGNGVDRVFQVLGGANAVFGRLTIEGGVAQDDGSAGVLPGTTESEGGGLLVQDGGNVTLSHVWLNHNVAIGGKGAHGRLVCGPGSSNCGVFPGSPGQVAAGGGLFLSGGAVNLIDSQILGNAARGGGGGTGGRGGAGGVGAGGGLYIDSGTTVLLRSTVSDNHATGGFGGSGNGRTAAPGSPLPGGSGGVAQGAGLFVGAGALRLTQTTVSGNSAAGGLGGLATFSGGGSYPASGGSAQGGGLFVASGNIVLANSTLFANNAKGGNQGFCPWCTHPAGFALGGNAKGGALYINGGSVSLTADTIASNKALTGSERVIRGSSYGGGIANAGATSLVAKNTLVGENEQDSGRASNGNDVSGAIVSSFSLIAQTSGAMITDNGGNIFNEDPALDPRGLRWNGGPAQTAALEDGSPAIDAGDHTTCVEAPISGIDQRGFRRFPQADNLCDIGAFEYTALLILPTSVAFEDDQLQTPGTVWVNNNKATSAALSISMGGADPGAFIEDDNCGTTLFTNCAIQIFFKPQATGTRSAILTVRDSSDRASPYIVTLTGVGE